MASKKQVRVADIGQPVSTRCAAEGWTPYILAPGVVFDASHPLVKEQAWAFEPVEAATANPGERRTVRRKKDDE